MPRSCIVSTLAGLLWSASLAVASEGYDHLATLAAAGTGEEILLAYVAAAPAPFALSPEEIVRLKEMGVPAPVIVAAITHGRAVPAAAARPADFNASGLTRIGQPNALAGPPPAPAPPVVVQVPPPTPVTVVQAPAPAPVVVHEPEHHCHRIWRDGAILGVGVLLGRHIHLRR